jgi:hypothetical protein
MLKACLRHDPRAGTKSHKLQLSSRLLGPGYFASAKFRDDVSCSQPQATE